MMGGPALIITPLTGVHVFHYLLALEGWEAPYPVAAEVWPVFASFLRMPSDCTQDVASVWVGPVEGGENSVQLILSRELTGEVGGTPQMRAPNLTFLWEFEALATFPPVEFRSDQYPSLDEFLAAAEASLSATSIWRAWQSWAAVGEEYDFSDGG
jgi:hypothetical protein